MRTGTEQFPYALPTDSNRERGHSGLVRCVRGWLFNWRPTRVLRTLWLAGILRRPPRDSGYLEEAAVCGCYTTS